jgi:hypothetical protein
MCGFPRRHEHFSFFPAIRAAGAWPDFPWAIYALIESKM